MEIQENNLQLCEELWNELEPSIRRLCEYKLSSHPTEVDEVVAEAYFVLCNAIERRDDIENPKAWLYGVANNLIKIKYTELEENKRRLVRLENVEYELFYDIDFDDAILTPEELNDVIAEVKAELLDSELTLYNMIYVKKLKFRRIAVILNISEHAVKQKHYRLKNKIKHLVKEKLKKI